MVDAQASTILGPADSSHRPAGLRRFAAFDAKQQAIETQLAEDGGSA